MKVIKVISTLITLVIHVQNNLGYKYLSSFCGDA